MLMFFFGGYVNVKEVEEEKEEKESTLELKQV